MPEQKIELTIKLTPGEWDSLVLLCRTYATVGMTPANMACKLIIESLEIFTRGQMSALDRAREIFKEEKYKHLEKP